MSAVRLALVLLVLGPAVACSATPSRTVSTAPPHTGSCRTLTPAAVARPADQTPAVSCARDHTTETFLVARFPSRLRGVAYTSSQLGRYVYDTCQPAFVTYLGGDESIAMRSLFSWAWFRPTRAAWEQRARWFRCDVVGGPDDARSYRALPHTTRSALAAKPPERWMTCATGPKVSGPKVPCSDAHDWRAVTTIKVGQPQDAYPGDRIVALRSQQFCSDSVGGWLGYPATDYQYGVTTFHEAEWRLGNRRSICWARTTT